MTIASASSTATHIALTTLFSAVQDAHLLNSTAGILGWDQETMMPNGGAELRSRQLAQLAVAWIDHDQHSARNPALPLRSKSELLSSHHWLKFQSSCFSSCANAIH